MVPTATIETWWLKIGLIEDQATQSATLIRYRKYLGFFPGWSRCKDAKSDKIVSARVVGKGKLFVVLRKSGIELVRVRIRVGAKTEKITDGLRISYLR